jgi:hypothetical protein
MPDKQGNERAEEERTPDTPLHAHADDREEDVRGGPDPKVGEEGDVDEGPGNPVGDDEDERA